MASRKLTEWFPAHAYDPVRVGWYDYRLLPSYSHPCDRGVDRCWWDGKRWQFDPEDKSPYGWPGYPWDEWRGRLMCDTM